MSCPHCHCRLATRSSVPGRLVCADCGEPLPRVEHQRSGSPQLVLLQSVLILLGMAVLAVGMTFADTRFSPEHAKEPARSATLE